MFIYFLVFLVGIVYYVIATDKYSHSKYLLALYLLYLALFVGLGDMIGGFDRYIYGEVFDLIADITRSDKDYTKALYLVNGQEYGYFLWQILVSYVTANRYIFILISTIFMYVLYFVAIKDYADRYPMACLVFLGIFYYFTITYIRQTIAVGIAWQAVRYIWQRKPYYYFGIMFLAYSFHNSALIFMPMYFMPIRKFSSHAIILSMIICLVIGLTPLPSLLMSGTGDATGMETRTDSYSTKEMVGFRWEYLMEAVFFVTLFLMNYPYIKKDKKTLTFLNMSFFFCAVLLVFIRFGQGGRFGWYFFIGIIYMLTKLSYTRRISLWMKSLSVILCFVLFSRITMAWAFNLTPYKTFLTDGLPSGEYYIYDKYEYDENYTIDKLYR